jgi:fructose PTS system EIIBC or EIIC component
VIGLIGRPGRCLVALLAGILVTAACVIMAKPLGRRAPARTELAAVPTRTAAATG